MSEPPVAPTLAAHIAVSSPAARIWRRVAHGELTADEAARLVEELEPLDEQELEAAKDVFSPLTRSREQGQLDAVLERLEGERPAASSSTSSPMRWVVGPLALAAAVLLVLWLVPRSPGDTSPFSAGYEVELEKGITMTRGSSADEEIPQFLAHGKILIWLRPEEAVAEDVAVVGFARDQAGAIRTLALEPTLPSPGVIMLDTTVSALGLDEGEWELVFAIGRPGALPSSWDELDGKGAAGYEVVRTRISVVASP